MKADRGTGLAGRAVRSGELRAVGGAVVRFGWAGAQAALPSSAFLSSASSSANCGAPT